jgi:hypothetical protein
VKRGACARKEACLARPWEYRPLVFGLLQGLVPGDRRYQGVVETVLALRLLAEQHRGGHVPEHFRAEPDQERQGEIPVRADLESPQRELQILPDISDPTAARLLVCTHLERLGGEMARCPARDSSRQLRGVRR